MASVQSGDIAWIIDKITGNKARYLLVEREDRLKVHQACQRRVTSSEWSLLLNF